ncbi:MAG: fasciclin domain-containing protein [Winogradskyella sp.]|uniref:fasciclin domain-containing protein n=1 Tax=Winogradskyella sp. TaxID=1883156 RepID=UPI00385994B2
MKIISKNFKLLAVFLLVIGVTACGDDDDNNVIGIPSTTVVDVAIANGFSSLATALTVTGLVDDLQGTGPFTVFAPTNDAFDDLLDATGLDLNNLTTDQEALVRNILLNHVIVGSTITSADLGTLGSGYVNTMATGPNAANLSLYFNTADGVVLNGQSNVDLENVDLEATNGIVHVVNDVIALPTIASFATSNGALSSLVAAIQSADNSNLPEGTWLGTVSGTDNTTLAPFTVFAPTNDAFAALLLELDPTGNTGLGDVAPATVDAILTYHVVAGSNVQSSGLAALNGVIPTLGGDLTLDGTTITDSNGRDSAILAPQGLVNIQAINGVVHAIDTVILPPQ